MDIKIPSLLIRADQPVKVGEDLVFSGTMYIGNTRAHLVARVPFQEAMRGFERAQGWAARAKFPMLRGLDDVEAEGFEDPEEAAGFLDGVLKFAGSPLGKTVKAAASLIPGVNMVAGPAFAAADVVASMKRGKKPRRKAVQLASPTDLKKATAAFDIVQKARGGDQKALLAFAKLRLTPPKPGTEAQRDHLLLDAAQMYADGNQLFDPEDDGDD